MRGKPVARLQDGQRPRITPAHAGKTSERMPCVRQIADHPRACGENLVRLCDRLRHGGSPPRMRGKPEYTVEGLSARRITPAHAGKTDKAGYGLAQWTDHPRACGENYSKRLKISHRFGSPPRMRGKPPWHTII